MGKASPPHSLPGLSLLLLSPSSSLSLSPRRNAVFPESLSNKITSRAPRAGLCGWEAEPPSPLPCHPLPKPQQQSPLREILSSPSMGLHRPPSNPSTRARGGHPPPDPQVLPPSCSPRAGRVHQPGRGPGGPSPMWSPAAWKSFPGSGS